MIRASEAKERVYARGAYNYYKDQIESAIMQAVSINLLHCDWYTYAEYDCTDGDIVEIQYIVDELKDLGYKVRITVFQANKDFDNVRIKLHINWE